MLTLSTLLAKIQCCNPETGLKKVFFQLQKNKFFERNQFGTQTRKAYSFSLSFSSLSLSLFFSLISLYFCLSRCLSPLSLFLPLSLSIFLSPLSLFLPLSLSLFFKLWKRKKMIQIIWENGFQMRSELGAILLKIFCLQKD